MHSDLRFWIHLPSKSFKEGTRADKLGDVVPGEEPCVCRGVGVTFGNGMAHWRFPLEGRSQEGQMLVIGPDS